MKIYDGAFHFSLSFSLSLVRFKQQRFPVCCYANVSATCVNDDRTFCRCGTDRHNGRSDKAILQQWHEEGTHRLFLTSSIRISSFLLLLPFPSTRHHFFSLLFPPIFFLLSFHLIDEEIETMIGTF